MTDESDTAQDDAVLIWQARTTARSVVGAVFTCLLGLALTTGLLYLTPLNDPWFGRAAVVTPVVVLVLNVIATLRGRVVVTPESIEVRKILTRHYSWGSLLSVSIEDDGRIEITPKGWVRKLPIPPSDAPAALEVITAWCAAALLPNA